MRDTHTMQIEYTRGVVLGKWKEKEGETERGRKGKRDRQREEEKKRGGSRRSFSF